MGEDVVVVLAAILIPVDMMNPKVPPVSRVQTQQISERVLG